MDNFIEKIKIKNNAKFVLEIHKTREKFIDIVKQFLLSNGIKNRDILTGQKFADLLIHTEGIKGSNRKILWKLSDMNIDALKFSFSSEKLVTINID